jgi:hypothetical protein
MSRYDIICRQSAFKGGLSKQLVVFSEMGVHRDHGTVTTIASLYWAFFVLCINLSRFLTRRTVFCLSEITIRTLGIFLISSLLLGIR